MSPGALWRRLIRVCRRERARWPAPRFASPLDDRPRLAGELLESVSPSVLHETGFLRRRRVRRMRYVRVRGLR